MRKLVFAICALQVQLAFADTKVIFFGGHGASQEQMDCWVAGAKKQKRWSGYDIQAYGYPDTRDFKHPAVIAAAAKDEINQVADEINSHPHTHYILIGHSSGCAVSDAIAEKITDPRHAKLINLEGFRPSDRVQKRMKTLCVYSETTRTKEEIDALRERDRHRRKDEARDLTEAGQLVGLNADSMKSCNHSLRVPGHHCKSVHCLHFSLANLMAPEELHSDYPKNGYKGCYANLTYLPEAQSPEMADALFDDPPQEKREQHEQPTQGGGASS